MFRSAEPQFRLHRNGHPRHIKNASGGYFIPDKFFSGGPLAILSAALCFDTRGGGLFFELKA
jgi:hypothetical protein